MVCFHPKYVYQNRSMPIECGHDEELLHLHNKVSFQVKKNAYQTQIPCGHCLGCVLDKANDWATRIWCEKQQWQHSCFVTLTYNNDHLPINDEGYSTLKKEDLQKFKKRLRKHFKGIEEWENPRTGKIERPIRTFECGEYGTHKTLRPHYHMAILNWEPDDIKFYKYNKHGQPLYTSKKLQDRWRDNDGKPIGFVIIGNLNYESASYIARYTMKKVKDARVIRKYYWEEELDKKTGEYKMKRHFQNIFGKREPEFLTMSRSVGIGKKYFLDNIEKIKRNSGIFIGNKLKRIPRYFKKVWEQKDWEDYHRWKWKFINDSQKMIKEKLKKLNVPIDWDFEKIEFWYLKQQEKILIDKAQSLKRNNYEDV